jgi:hypothetical protein
MATSHVLLSSPAVTPYLNNSEKNHHDWVDTLDTFTEEKRMARRIVPLAVALSMFLAVGSWTGAAAGSVSITCPVNQVVLATSGAGAVVLYPPPAVTSLCPGETVECSPPAGSLFPVGTTMVTCTATAFLGDEATCAFTVHVEGASEQTTDLITQVRSYHLKAGIETSLVSKLQAVLNALDAGR